MMVRDVYTPVDMTNSGGAATQSHSAAQRVYDLVDASERPLERLLRKGE